MRFLANFEIRREDLDKVIEAWRRRTSSRRAVKTLFPPHTLAETTEGIKGFLVFESDDEDEITRYLTEYMVAGARFRITPIWESSKGVVIYEKMKT